VCWEGDEIFWEVGAIVVIYERRVRRLEEFFVRLRAIKKRYAERRVHDASSRGHCFTRGDTGSSAISETVKELSAGHVNLQPEQMRVT
jgi:hypothetical protein